VVEIGITDIKYCYITGMLMYEMLTEYVPYSDTGDSNVIALVTKIISGAKLVFPKLANKYQGHEQAIKEATSIIISCHSNGLEQQPSFSVLMSFLKPLPTITVVCVLAV